MRKTKILIGVIAGLTPLAAAISAHAQSVRGQALPDTVTYQERYRPRYHLTPPRGALFDPTALVYTNGHYRVNKGIAQSADLVHWKLGKAQSLRTDSVGEMSGSAVVDSGNTSGFGLNGQPPMVAIYSGLRRRDGAQFQCIAYSNDQGRTWTNYQHNPVIDIGSTEFRDPQVFWYAPQKKWVMVVALAADRKIRFYESHNLKDWQFMSDFGPYGAVNGVWECPDFFELPVKGAPGLKKWVLEVSVQPISGQYFVGSFDGRVFTADPDFRKTASVPMPKGQVLFDFEQGLAGWQREGEAFSQSPAKGSLPHQNAVLGYAGSGLLNSFYPEDAGTGKLTSPEFTIDRPFLNFLLGGGLHEKTVCVNLVIGGRVERTKTGTDTEVLYWTGWDVSAFKGQKAHLEVLDEVTGAFGHILLDQVMLSNEPASSTREPAFWLDYGPDFYAVRSWVNGPAADKRRVSVAWLGSWLYAVKVPTVPWKGGHTFPRSVELVKQTDGIRLVQNPVRELSRLRGRQLAVAGQTLAVGKSAPLKVNPSRNAYELVADLNLFADANLELALCAKRDQRVLVRYDAVRQQLSVDRTRSGVVNFSPTFPAVYTAPLRLKAGKLRLHILVDESSIEVFGNDGAINLTCQIFPDSDARSIDLRLVKGSGKLNRMDIWELNSIWTANKP